MLKEEINLDVIEQALQEFQGDPFVFFEEAWGLTPQPIKHRYLPMLEHLMTTPAKYFNLEVTLFTSEMFGEFDFKKHLTWQQTLLLIAVKRAINDTLPRQISVCSGKGTGKLLGVSETVWKIVGNATMSVRAGDIKVGDTILGSSAPTKVTGVYPQAVQKLYKVKFDDGSEVLTSLDHLWTVSDHQTRVKLDKRHGGDKNSEEGKWETITTEEILRRGLRLWSANIARFRVPKQVVQGHISVRDAYVVGVWYGDGTKGTSTYSKPDEFVSEKIKSQGCNVSDVYKNSNRSGTRNIYRFKERMKELNIPISSKEYLPPNFLSWDIESRTELLRGLMDTDGYCDTRGNAEFSSSIPSLAEDVALLIRSLGGKTSVRVKEKTFYNDENGKRVYCKPSYRLTVSTKFNPFSLPRKAERYRVASQDRYHVRFITAIEESVTEAGVCYTVDAEDKLYLAGNGLIPTHNTFLVSGIMLWFMFAFPLCRVMATAPTGDQLFSVLWSELSSGIQRMKEFFRKQYIWQNKFIRMVAKPEGWFARAKTSAPGEHGALAGLHSEHMLAVVDEAASVEEGVIDEARYTMTNENNLIILISNAHTATSFFKSTFEEGSGWINIIFNAEESPIVSASTIAKVLQDCGGDRDHDKYRVHVRGLFPKAGLLDDSEGWRRMFDEKWIDAFFSTSSRDTKLSAPYVGVDVGGEGEDTSEGYARDALLAKPIFTERTSTPESVAKLTIKASEQLEAEGPDISIDNFGAGADVSAKITLLSERDLFTRGVNLGMKCEDPDDRRVYFNERARVADMLLKWGIQGGKCLPDEQLMKELEHIYCREDENGKLRIMPKKVAKKMGIKSPNKFDALILTFPQDTAFAMRVPRGDHMYYPDRPEESSNDETKVSDLNRHRMIPIV